MNNNANGFCMLVPQVTGKIVRAVAQLFRQIKNALFGVFINRLVILQSPANRGSRNIQLPGNIINGYILFSLHVPLVKWQNKNYGFFSIFKVGRRIISPEQRTIGRIKLMRVKIIFFAIGCNIKLFAYI